MLFSLIASLEVAAEGFLSFIRGESPLTVSRSLAGSLGWAGGGVPGAQGLPSSMPGSWPDLLDLNSDFLG